MDNAAENKNKYIALGFTLGFHALLFLLFIWIVFITPIPPFPEQPTIETEVMDLGGLDGMGKEAGGSGNHDTDIKTSPEDVSPKPVANNTPNIATDETTTGASVKTNPKAKPTATEEDKTPEEEKASQELLATLAKLKSKHAHTGEGEGNNNTGGSGNGTSTGVSNGNDPEEGNGKHHGQGGPGVDLKGRTLLNRPDKLTDATDEGVVVVAIVVDETGKVISAIPGQRGSSTLSQKLYSKARLAALQVKFNPSPDGIKEQRGTYTVVFTLE